MKHDALLDRALYRTILTFSAWSALLLLTACEDDVRYGRQNVQSDGNPTPQNNDEPQETLERFAFQDVRCVPELTNIPGTFWFELDWNTETSTLTIDLYGVPRGDYFSFVIQDDPERETSLLSFFSPFHYNAGECPEHLHQTMTVTIPREQMRENFDVAITQGYNEPDFQNVVFANLLGGLFFDRDLHRDKSASLRLAPLLDVQALDETTLEILWENNYTDFCTEELIRAYALPDYAPLPFLVRVYQFRENSEPSCQFQPWREESLLVEDIPLSTTVPMTALGRNREGPTLQFVPLR